MFGADAVRCMRRGNGGGGDIELGDDFILLIDTSLPSADLTTTLSWYGPLDITIDWGDGTVETFTETSVGNFKFPHTYPIGGQYEIHVSGTASSTGFGPSTERSEWLKCIALGTVTDNFSSAFSDARNLISAPDKIPAGAKNMRSMFYQASALETGLVNWDVSQVTDMSQMLMRTRNFNQDLSGWCVTNITTLPYYFATNSALAPEHYPVWGTCP